MNQDPAHISSLRSKPWMSGLAVAVGGVATTTAVIFVLRDVVPVVSTGVLYLLIVLLVSSYWGLWLGLATAIASALAFNWFHIPPTGRFTIAEAENWIALGVYFVAAVVVSTLAGAARSRELEAEERRAEASLASDLARIILGGSDLEASLSAAATRIGTFVGSDSVLLRLGWTSSEEGLVAVPLVATDDQRERVGTLLISRRTTTDQLEHVERIVPSLTALVSAALKRERLEAQLVETKALRRSDGLKTALLRAVSHDFRSPITAIRTAAGAVGSPTVPEHERSEMAHVITEESERLAHLVDNLLDLSKLETGTAVPQLEECSVEELIEAATAAVGKHAVIDIQLDKSLPLVKVDSAQIERALVNLLANAARYSDGEPVSVRAHTHGKRVLLRVTDKGPGIVEEELSRIFEPFYRADGQQGGGSGLGLAIAKGFVEANGGRLWAQSLPDQGASFVLELPLERVPEKSS